MPAPTRFLPLVTAVLMCAAAATVGDDYQWQGAGTGGNTATDPADPTTLWSNPANWLEGTVPDDEDTAYIPFSNAGRLNAETTTVGELRIDGPSLEGAFAIDGGVIFAVNGKAYVGDDASGRVIQTGGEHRIHGNLYLGYDHEAAGIYELQSGSLIIGYAYYGYYGAGTFTQSGGTHTAYRISLGASHADLGGTYLLSDGSLLVEEELRVGVYGTAEFIQTGGTNTVRRLVIKSKDGSPTYTLGGGNLTAVEEIVFGQLFSQTGGSNTVDYLEVSPGGCYEFAGGDFQITTGLLVRGTLDLGGTNLALAPDAAIVDLTEGEVLNAEQASLHLGPGSLVLVTPDSDPAALFKEYSNAGITHTKGGPLVLAAGQGFAGSGTIRDFVESAGTIAASDGGHINLYGGFAVTGGQVDLGNGRLLTYKNDSLIRDGSIAAGSASVHDATLTQTGGALTVADELEIHEGTYELRAGTLDVGHSGKRPESTEMIGGYGGASFVQSGGTHVVHGRATVAGGLEQELGVYRQSGGTFTTDELWLGYEYEREWASSAYLLSEGVLTIHSHEMVGSPGSATFIQTGGTHTVGGTLWVGNPERYDHNAGTMILEGGSLVTGSLRVGHGFSCHFGLTGKDAYLEVRDTFWLGSRALVTVADGATVHMTGSAFENHSTNEAALAGLENLTMIFEGGTDYWATFEVASEDLGAGPLGFLNNFALGSLLVGGAEPAMLRLEDAFDNGNRASFEALYVHDLVIGPGSSLDLNGLHLYYDGTFVGEGTVTGGVPAWVPEPATVAFVLLGSLLLLVRRRNRL